MPTARRDVREYTEQRFYNTRSCHRKFVCGGGGYLLIVLYGNVRVGSILTRGQGRIETMGESVVGRFNRLATEQHHLNCSSKLGSTLMDKHQYILKDIF